MQHILILGAGRSATDFIQYLLDQSLSHDWEIVVGDYNLALAQEKVGSHPKAKAIFFDLADDDLLQRSVQQADLVASFLPAHMHKTVAKACLAHSTHMITASYISPELKLMDEAAREKDLLFLAEMGADPGLDHMSAMQHIDEIKAKGGDLISFKSYTGALVAPACENNPWGYKFTWMPMNVVLAGQGGAARYIRDQQFRYLPYHRLFTITDTVKVPGAYGELEAYANRDSLPYCERYGLADVPTLIRGTLRVPGYCEAWNVLVQLGVTDNTYRIADSHKITYGQWLRSYLPAKGPENVEELLASFIGVSLDSPVMERLRYLEICSDRPVSRENGTPAEILLDLLMEKWKFEDSDTDTLIMVHEFIYTYKVQTYKRTSSLASEGLDHQHTAISRTVGLPAGIGARLMLEGKIKARGVHIPVTPEIYAPILEELKQFSLDFEESEEIYVGTP